MATFLSLVKFFPLFIDIVKQIEILIKDGIDIIQIKDAYKSVDKAFVKKIAADRARGLNDVFRIP